MDKVPIPTLQLPARGQCPDLACLQSLQIAGAITRPHAIVHSYCLSLLSPIRRIMAALSSKPSPRLIVASPTHQHAVTSERQQGKTKVWRAGWPSIGRLWNYPASCCPRIPLPRTYPYRLDLEPEFPPLVFQPVCQMACKPL